jgi:hypothetical protein
MWTKWSLSCPRLTAATRTAHESLNGRLFLPTEIDVAADYRFDAVADTIAASTPVGGLCPIPS